MTTTQDKTFDEWIKGFEERYTEEQLRYFRLVWDKTVLQKRVNREILTKDKAWEIKWITEVAYKIGK